MKSTGEWSPFRRPCRAAGLLVLMAALLCAGRLHAFPYPTANNVTATVNDRVYESADVKWGDADNDGNLDIVVCGHSDNNNRQLEMFSGNGAGGWGTATDIAGANAGLGFCALALGDLNNDGLLDVAVTGRVTGTATNNAQAVRVYFRGAAGWTQTVVNSGASAVESGGLSLGDYDNDGDLDMLVTGIHRTSNAISLTIYQNNGNGTFTAITPTGTQGIWNGGAAWGDYDGDGNLDMLVSGSANATETTRRVRVYHNNGDGTWTAIDLTPGLSLGDVAWADLNGDGLLDVVASGTSDGTNEQIRWWANNGAGGFGAAQLVAANNGGLSQGRLAVGDVDRDGDLDIVANGSQNGTTPQLIVYTNNGSGVFTANAVANGLLDGAVALADADNNGTLDLASVGTTNGTQANRSILYYPSSSAANTAPNAPSGLAAAFSYVPAGTSSIAFKWNPATDAGAGATPQNLLVYDIQISTTAAFTGTSVFPSQLGASPRRGAYYRPPVIAGQHTVYLKSATPLDPDPAPYGLQANTTYYFRVKTLDAGLMESGWSATASVYAGVPPPAVANLSVAAATTDGQIVLNWTAPALAAGGSYDVRWSLSAITSDALFNAATPLTGEPSPGASGAAETMAVRGVPPEQTVFFALKAVGPGGTGALSNSPSGVPLAFDRTPIEVAGAADLGLDQGDVTWGDVDGDGLWDVVVEGYDGGGTRRLRVYRNNGAGGFVTTPLELSGLANGNVALGDFNGDGKLDILASGNSAAGVKQLRVYVNASTPGILSFPTIVNVPGAANLGLDTVATNNGGGCGLEWADMNSDGDLDVVACGEDSGGTARLYVYFNNGNGTFNPAPATVDGNFYQWGDLAVADFNNDNKPDIAALGYNTASSVQQLAIYTNVNGSSFTQTILPGGLSSGALDAGDFDNDGKADLLIQGFDTNRQLRVYRNTTATSGGAPTFAAAVNVTGAVNQGLNRGEVAWGDYNNDGFLDVLAQGSDTGAVGDGGELRLYAGNGTSTGWAAAVNVAQTNTALVNEGAVAWGDFDQDGDLDVVVSGADVLGTGGVPQLRVYRNYWGVTPGASNNPPSAPTGLASDFTFSTIAASTATFKWLPAVDDITPAAGLRYQVEAATNAAFSLPLAINTPSPQYFPQIYDGNARLGALLVSTDPWNPQAGTLTGLMTDTTYYFRVMTIDAGFLESGWSGVSSLWTGVNPGTSTVAASSPAPGQAALSWLSAGDDANKGNLTGNYRIQYATTSTVAWSTSATPSGAFTVTVATAGAVPGAAQAQSFSSLLEGTSYYFRLWTQDKAGQWSLSSNQTTTYVLIGVRDIAISTTGYAFGNVPVGQSTQTTTAITATYTGNVNGTLRLYASTVTAGSPWTLGSATGADSLVLYGGFNAAQPTLAAFGAEDVVLNGSQACTATVFALGQTCLNLSPGSVRTLWFRLDMPSSSSTSSPQDIQVTVEAGP